MQQRPAFRPFSPHRVAKLTAWARLWLCWLASVLFQMIKEDSEFADRLTRFGAWLVTGLILQTALQTYRPTKVPRRFGIRRMNASARIVRGSRLRKATSKRNPVERLAATLEMMRDFDREVARFRRRIASGLRRWHGQAYAWQNEALNASVFLPAACADSS